jgi:hypothetical protein
MEHETVQDKAGAGKKERFDSLIICGETDFLFSPLGGLKGGFLLKFFGMLGRR